jgi:hypothetical protein
MIDYATRQAVRSVFLKGRNGSLQYMPIAFLPELPIPLQPKKKKATCS